MRLLFYQDAEASDAQLRLLNLVSRAVRARYSKLIDEMGETHASNVDWWVSELAARNIFVTPLFTRLCQLALVRKLLDENTPPSEIVVDSAPLYWVFKKAGLPVRFRFSGQLTLRFFLKPIYHLTTSIAKFALRWSAGRPGPFPESATLIHTFLHATSFQKGSHLDRYFGDMLSQVGEKDQKNCYYVPAAVRTWNFSRLFRMARSSNRNFLLREDYLRATDYLFAIGFPFRYSRLKTSAPKFSGFSIGPLIWATKWYSAASPSSLEGLLAFRFAMRVKPYENRIRLVIDWFENQAMNHGMNAGVRWHLPSVPTKGYQGYLNPDMMVSTFPTELEMKSGVVPEEIMVMGKSWVDAKKEFCSTLDVKVAPAFRYQHLLKERVSSEPEPVSRRLVLVALPIQVDESVVILKLVKKALELLPSPPDLVIKPHPHLALERAQKHFPSANWVTGDFNGWLERAKVLVSSSSSVCLEAVLSGVPSLILRGPDGMAYSPIPAQVPTSLWRICLNERELANALQHFTTTATPTYDLGTLKKDYFAVFDAESTKHFLDLNA